MEHIHILTTRMQTYTCRTGSGERMAFDVDAAQALAFTLETFRAKPTNLRPDAESVTKNYDGFDEAYAMATRICAEEPLITIEEIQTIDGKRAVRLIDGWHRLYKAIKLDLPCVWIVVIPAEMVPLITLYRVGPGEPMPEGMPE